MNEIFHLLYQVMYKVIFLNLKFTYTTRLHGANFLSFSGKRGDIKYFCKTARVSPICPGGVIKTNGMIALLTAIMVISFISALLKYLH